MFGFFLSFLFDTLDVLEYILKLKNKLQDNCIEINQKPKLSKKFKGLDL